MEFENLGDWCKWLEKNFSPELLIPTLPVIIRLDGNNFSKWTKGLKKPFDQDLSRLMIETTKFLVKETNAVVGYTQSDEITLILYTSSRKVGIYNGGRKQKILSKLTSKCTQFFNEERVKYLPNHQKLATFDCRVYQTPTQMDACAQLIWRENDATRNSKLLLAEAYLGKNLFKLKTDKLQDLLIEKGVNWNDLEPHFKRGTYVKVHEVSKPWTVQELSKLPAKHYAHKTPDLKITRKVITELQLPPITKVTNIGDVIFKNEYPLY